MTSPDEVQGLVSPELEQVVEELVSEFDDDHSFQVTAFRHGERVLDIWAGPGMREDSLTVPFSVSKNTIGFTVGLVLQRGELDLDRLVADYWPEFAQAGKQHVTVRQLLTHQAGLPQAEPVLTLAEVLDHHAGAERLAQTRPFWRPGTAFGYHAWSIGNLASELIHRATGRTLHEVYEDDIRAPHGIDFFLGLPEELDHRLVPLQPMHVPDDAPEPDPTPVGTVVWDRPVFDLSTNLDALRFGHPAVTAVGTARGIASLLALGVTGVGEHPALLDEDTVACIGEQQVSGFDEVLGLPERAHGVVFQKPTQQVNWGGPRSFGHDGARGAVGCVDPTTGVAFAYTVVRGPWPGGADPRAVRAAAAVNRIYR